MDKLKLFLKIVTCLIVGHPALSIAQQARMIPLRIEGRRGYYDPVLNHYVFQDEYYTTDYELRTRKLAKPVKDTDPLCSQSLLDSLKGSKEGRAFISAMEKAFGPGWLETIPALKLPTALERAEAGRLKGGTGYIDYIIAEELEQLGSAIAWGCDEYKRPFITVVYNVYMPNKEDILERGVVQTFFSRYVESPHIWRLAGTGYLGNVGTIDVQDFENLVRLIKNGSLTVKNLRSERFPIVELHIPDFALKS